MIGHEPHTIQAEKADASSEGSEDDFYSDEESEEEGGAACKACLGPVGVSGFRCANASDATHATCTGCSGRMPRTVSTADVALQCLVCSCWSCHQLWGCAAQERQLRKLKEHSFHALSAPSLNFNLFEQEVLNNYLSSKSMSVDDMFAHCLRELDANQIQGHSLVLSTGSQLNSDTDICAHCAAHRVLPALCYHFRANISQDELPASVTTRNDCWYGRNCRTQRHKPDHARRLNHICEQIRR